MIARRLYTIGVVLLVADFGVYRPHVRPLVRKALGVSSELPLYCLSNDEIETRLG
jgi:hypothetical protein